MTPTTLFQGSKIARAKHESGGCAGSLPVPQADQHCLHQSCSWYLALYDPFSGLRCIAGECFGLGPHHFLTIVLLVFGYVHEVTNSSQRFCHLMYLRFFVFFSLQKINQLVLITNIFKSSSGDSEKLAASVLRLEYSELQRILAYGMTMIEAVPAPEESLLFHNDGDWWRLTFIRKTQSSMVLNGVHSRGNCSHQTQN